MSNTFEYLETWSKERLQKRLEKIKPLTRHLVEAFNAEYKLVVMQLDYISDTDRTEQVEMLFSTDADNANGFPDTLKKFLHDYCTIICAEKLTIESLLSRMI